MVAAVPTVGQGGEQRVIRHPLTALEHSLPELEPKQSSTIVTQVLETISKCFGNSSSCQAGLWPGWKPTDD